jgi:Leucine-rich repeat (LRR) protein
MNRFRNIVLIAGISALCFGLAGCQKNTEVDEVYIADKNFKAALLNSTINGNRITKSDTSDPAIDANGDGKISKAEAAAVVTINVDSLGIKTLVGVEAFVNVKNLDCAGNDIDALDLSANASLQVLDCSHNELKSLDLSANAGLKAVYCEDNHLAGLELNANANLGTLYCQDNDLTSLDLKAFAGLKVLCCQDNDLTKLDISANAQLERLYCQGNMIVSLDASNLSVNVDLLCGSQTDANGKPVTMSLTLSLNFRTIWDTLMKLLSGNINVSVKFR